MTVRVEREIELPVAPERVWEFISDTEKRAGAISVVDSFEVHGDGRATWHVRLPIPLLDRTVPVETRELSREPPTSVTFVGESSAMDVRGEHEIVETGEGCRLVNSFVVDGKLPGVESYFRKNLDRELRNLGDALEAELGEDL